MGHASSTFLLQVSEFDRLYKNPYKQGGRGIKYTKWKTIDGRMFLKDAKEMWLEYFRQKDPAKLTKYRVRYKGQTVISNEGRVYERVTAPGTNGKGEGWMRFVEELV